MRAIELTIDGQVITVPEGTTILDAARELNIDIPALCHEPKLSPSAACRLCVVEDEKTGKLIASCAVPASDGQVVKTESPTVVEARRMVLELLLANHPLDCLTCDRSGDCQLQEYCYRYQIAESPFVGETRQVEIDDNNPFFLRDYRKCILCGKCVKVCHEVEGAGAVDYVRRGFATLTTTPYDEDLENTPCEFCGMCVELCPTGALVPKLERFAGRSWELEHTTTTCVYCGVGCQLTLAAKNGRVVGVSVPDAIPNNGEICVKGKFGWDFVNHPERLTKPLVRQNGVLVETSWEEALSYTAARLQKTKEQYGPDAVAGLSSAKCTNEENYLFQKLMRSVLETHNVDHCARLCHASTVTGLATAFGSAAMTNSIAELENTSVILVIGSNTTEAHPVIGYRIRKAVRQGSKLIVCDPRQIALTQIAELHLQQPPGTDVALINGMLHVIIKEELYDEAFIAERTDGFDELKERIEDYPPEFVSKITGVPAEDIIKAARMYAAADCAAIVYSMGITQHTTGTDNVHSLANLALATGNLGKPSAGVNPLRGQNNVQGACDMGALPVVFPGYQQVTDAAAQKKFGEAWGKIPANTAGLTATEMIDAIDSGQLKALYVMGENPALSDPDVNHVKKALAAVDFLVVQDIFLSETTESADVVLPACSFAEKNGTFTNTERRVQRVRQAVLPIGQSRSDWEILIDLARRLGADWNYGSPEEIMEEIATVTPQYAGITYDRIEDEGIQWPCPSKDHPGTPYLHKGTFPLGRGKFHAISFIEPDETPDEEYPFLLTTGRKLNHFHTGTMSRRSFGLDRIHPSERVELHPDDAVKLGVTPDDTITITSRRGSVTAQVELTNRVPQGVVFMSFHFREAAANILTNPARDARAKIPELKVCAVRVEK